MKTGIALKACLAYQHGEISVKLLRHMLEQWGAFDSVLNGGLLTSIVLLCGGA